MTVLLIFIVEPNQMSKTQCQVTVTARQYERIPISVFRTFIRSTTYWQYKLTIYTHFISQVLTRSKYAVTNWQDTAKNHYSRASPEAVYSNSINIIIIFKTVSTRTGFCIDVGVVRRYNLLQVRTVDNVVLALTRI